MNKNLKKNILLGLILGAPIFSVCALNNNTISPTINLQIVLEKAIKEKEEQGAHLTGSPLTFQCHGVNHITIATGKISNNGDVLSQEALFQAGSMSKSFVAVIALQLSQEGRFGAKGLDSTVGEVLPNPPAYWNKTWNKITLRQLLNMTSGLQDPASTDASNIIRQYVHKPYQNITTDELLTAAQNQSLLFEPGQGWHYSDLGYLILHKLITQITGQSLKEHISLRILKPLHLEHTFYIEHLPQIEIPAAQHKLLMSGYAYLSQPEYLSQYVYPGVDVKNYSLSWMNAAGSIITNTIDLNGYIKALFSHDGILLTQKQFEELTTLVAEQSDAFYKAGSPLSKPTNTIRGYGLGIEALSLSDPHGKDIVLYEHGGNTMGFMAAWLYEPDRKASITLSVNSTDESSHLILNTLMNTTLSKMVSECRPISG
jgi:D-alanyl-D-alanine carboxypeptidase